MDELTGSAGRNIEYGEDIKVTLIRLHDFVCRDEIPCSDDIKFHIEGEVPKHFLACFG